MDCRLYFVRRIWLHGVAATIDWFLTCISRPEGSRFQKTMRISSDSVHMKMSNFQWFDPERIGGLEGGTWQSWEIWCERSGSGVNRPPRPGTRYSRCDDIGILALYFEEGRQPLSQWDPRVIELSKRIDHSPNSVHRRMANFQWIDPDRPGGLSRPSRESIRIWNDFAHDEQRLRETAANCRREIDSRGE